MSKDTSTNVLIPAATDSTTAAAGSPDELVFYRSTDGKVRPVKPREVERYEHGAVLNRWSKRDRAEVPHVVLTRAELDEPAVLVEALIGCLRFLGVAVRRSPRDHGRYGVQINRYNGCRQDESDQPHEGQEALLCGPINPADLVSFLHGAIFYAMAPDEFWPSSPYSNTRSAWAGSEGKFQWLTMHSLYQCYGYPEEVGEQPYPSLRRFVEELRSHMRPVEVTAAAALLGGRESELDTAQLAALNGPFGIEVEHGPGTLRHTRPMHRRDAPDVIW